MATSTNIWTARRSFGDVSSENIPDDRVQAKVDPNLEVPDFNGGGQFSSATSINQHGENVDTHRQLHRGVAVVAFQNFGEKGH